MLLDDGAAGMPRFELTERDGELWLVDRRPEPERSPELTESTFARIATTLRRFGRAEIIREVRVTHAEPQYAAEYLRIFQVPVTFGRERNELRIDRACFGAAMAEPSYGYPLLRDHAEALLAQLKRGRTLRAEVERLLVSAFPDAPTDIGLVAEQLGLGRQTLQRRLKREGSTFEVVRDDVRHRLALRYLGAAGASVAHTAWLLGLSDRASFSRAFRRWTGFGPGAWRTQTQTRLDTL